ncbi:MAG: acetylxylan esterase [Planctomycetes bacterium]|nr:acetylxylan esterase [Planctomycetota bacterium]
MTALALAIGLLALGDTPVGPKATDVKFSAPDGVIVGADYFEPLNKAGKSPVVILIHMRALDRKSWTPLVQPLLDSGFAVLAYDMRGRGASIEPAAMELRNRLGRNDPTLFLDAWKDAAGAVTFLESRPECDTKNIVVIGASNGFSIAVDFATRNSNVKALIGLSPYPKKDGLETSEQIKSLKDRRMLLMAPQQEYGRVQELVISSGGKADCEMLQGGPAQHGTNLFNEPNRTRAVELIVKFLGPVVAPPAGKPATNSQPKK